VDVGLLVPVALLVGLLKDDGGEEWSGLLGDEAEVLEEDEEPEKDAEEALAPAPAGPAAACERWAFA
jgi:hypothetical protein